MTATAPISGVPADVAPAQPAQATTPTAAAGTSQSAPTSPPATPAPSSLPLDDQPNLRLVIEDDKAAGSYVYMTVDVVTGQVVSQIPREQVLQMREAASYTPGSVINSVS